MNEDLKFRRPLSPYTGWETGLTKLGTHFFPRHPRLQGYGEKINFLDIRQLIYALGIHSSTEVSRRQKGFLQKCKGCNLQHIKCQ